jgi:hypothetical protein
VPLMHLVPRAHVPMVHFSVGMMMSRMHLMPFHLVLAMKIGERIVIFVINPLMFALMTLVELPMLLAMMSMLIATLALVQVMHLRSFGSVARRHIVLAVPSLVATTRWATIAFFGFLRRCFALFLGILAALLAIPLVSSAFFLSHRRYLFP